MAAIPFIYFSVLTVYWWRKHQTFDICVYMSSLYAFTSFCALLLVMFDMLEGGGILFDGWKAELNLIPTVLYCALLTLTIIPFSFFNSRKIQQIGNAHPLLLYIFSWVLIAQSFLNLYLVADTTAEVLSGDLSIIRDNVYDGTQSLADIKASTMPTVLQIFNYLNYSTILALPLYFYYACVQRSAWWFTTLLLFASLSSPLKGFQTADRTEFIIYGEMFFFSFILFRQFITKQVKRLFMILGIPFLAVVGLYLSTVSSDRFEETDAGTSGSVLQYAGQGYLNFCYFYENADPNLLSAEREFPIISYTLLKRDYSEVKETRSAQQGFPITVFATHMGAIMIDVGVIGAIIWAVLFAVFCLYVIRYYQRTEFDLSELLLLFVLGTIPIFGIFYYRFFSFFIALQIVFVFFFFILSKYRFVRSKNPESSSETLSNSTLEP